MTARYRLDPDRSRYLVQAFASGLLSFLAHSPTFAVREFAGEARFDPDTSDAVALQLTIRADSLELIDKVSAADREEIGDRMRREVLETAAYPEIRFDSTEGSAALVSGNEYQVRLLGTLSLHGVNRPHRLDAQLLAYPDGIRLGGETLLRLSEYRIRPVTALGGAIKLKDELRLAFDLVCWKEATEPEGS